MFTDTSSAISGDVAAFVSFERTDNNQISNITSYCNRYSSSDPNLRSLSRFRDQLLKNNTSETKFLIERNTYYSSKSHNGVY